MLQDASSCLDFIFTSQSNMVLDSVVHSSLHPSSHHQIVFAKFNLKVLHLTRGIYGIINMQIALRSKTHLHLSIGNKHILIALSIRRFLFLMKQLSMLRVIMFPMKQRYLITRNHLG